MKKLYLSILSSLLLCSAHANAADSQFYAGGGLGFAKSNVDESDSDIDDTDDSDLGFKLFGGYRINDSISAEVFYADLGEISQSGSFRSSKIGVNIDIKSFGAFGVYSHSLSDILDVFGKLGLQRWTANATLSQEGADSVDDDDDGIGVVAGGGIRANLSSRFFAGGELELFDMDGSTTMLSAHAGINF